MKFSYIYFNLNKYIPKKSLTDFCPARFPKSITVHRSIKITYSLNVARLSAFKRMIRNFTRKEIQVVLISRYEILN